MASLPRGLAVVLVLTTLVVPALPAAAEADMAGGWTVETTKDGTTIRR